MSWSEVTLRDIAMSGDKAEIGVTSGGQTLKVNDSTLGGG